MDYLLFLIGSSVFFTVFLYYYSNNYRRFATPYFTQKDIWTN